MCESVSKYYDKIASVYDQATAPELAWTPPAVLADSVGDLILNTNRVLDIGVGTGLSLEKFISKNNTASYVGLDVSEDMLKICAEKFPNVKLHLGDLKSFKESNEGQFDLIVSSGAFEFIADLNSVLSDVSQLLTDDGSLFFTFEPFIAGHKFQGERKSLVVEDKASSLYVKDFYTYRRDVGEIIELLESCGLSSVSQNEFVAYKKAETDIVYQIIHARHI